MIKAKGTWDGFTQNSDGVVKLNIVLPAAELANTVEFLTLVDEGVRLTVTPDLAGEEAEPLVFSNLIFFNLNVKGSGDAKISFKTVKEEMAGFSFLDLNSLVDSMVNIDVEVMGAESEEVSE